MDISLWILLTVTVALGLLAFSKGSEHLGEALAVSGRLVRGIWLELTLGFILAGLLEVLLPAPLLLRWLGGDKLGSGILVGWMVGLLLPGGPYLVFPVVANLLKQGAAPGPLIALVTAKVLVSPIRVLSYQAPLLGWPMTLARVLPVLFLPPVIGLVGQWLFELFNRKV